MITTWCLRRSFCVRESEVLRELGFGGSNQIDAVELTDLAREAQSFGGIADLLGDVVGVPRFGAVEDEGGAVSEEGRPLLESFGFHGSRAFRWERFENESAAPNRGVLN